jgi:osmotically-inducible protein OsmY
LPRAPVLLLALALLAAVPAFAADRDAEQKEAEARLTLQVRRALREEPALTAAEDTSVGVSVRGTVATLWGRVPSEALKKRALHLARVTGITEVRADDLWVPPGDESGLPSPFPEGAPPRGALAGTSRDGHITQAPKRSDPPDPGGAPPQRVVTLLPPVPLTGSPPPQPGGAGVVMLPPRPPTAPPELASSIEALRAKDDRFRAVKVEVRQKTVFVRGTVRRWDDVNDFADAVRRLPGVEAVILDSVQVDATGSR